MSYKDKIINKLKKGYTPVEVSPREDLTSTYKKIFKPIVDKKDLDFFIALFETNEVILRAWSFLGLYHILQERNVKEDDIKLKIQKIILELLKDDREIYYYGGSSEIRTSLREHHLRRICELDNNLIYKPVLEYVKSFENGGNYFIAELIEKVLSKSSDKTIENLIIRFSKSVDNNDLNFISYIINSFDSLGQMIVLNEKETITELFKNYLVEIKDDKRKNQEIINKKRELQKNIFRVGALLDLPLEEETLEFLESLKYPYHSLDQIAKRYKNNKKFKSILLKKLEESNNPRFIADILKSILILKDNIQNWKQLIIDNIKKYQIVDGILTTAMQESEVLNEDMVLSFLTESNKWNLEFIREFFINNPEFLDKWQNLRNEFIRILKLFDTRAEDFEKTKKIKEMILKLIIDLKRVDLTKYCLENFKNLKEEELKKLSLFPILKFGQEDILIELKELMKNDADSAKFVRRFWSRLERNDWRFFY
jgi:hypothetical protein